MKRNYLLILIFLLLGAGTAWYLLSKDGEQATSTLGWDRKFAVEDPNEIHKIFIAKRTGVTTTLERNGDHWIVNGDHKASPNAVKNVLEAITNVTLKFVPAAAATDHVVKQIAARGIKVEIYNKKGDKLKAYYIGGVSTDARGTFFLMENSEQPMAVEIPQMVGQIRTRFELEGDHWRDRTVFGFEPEEIEAVSVEYPKQRNKSFRMERKGGDFEVKPFYDNVPPIKREVVQGNVEGFLVGFKSLVAESFENKYPHKDSIRATIPFTVISVTGTDGEERKAALYHSYRTNEHTGERTSDIVERYLADIDDGEDWMLVQHRVFQQVFWPYTAFFEPAGVQVKD